jgi:hypothetical protein
LRDRLARRHITDPIYGAAAVGAVKSLADTVNMMAKKKISARRRGKKEREERRERESMREINV